MEAHLPYVGPLTESRDGRGQHSIKARTKLVGTGLEPFLTCAMGNTACVGKPRIYKEERCSCYRNDPQRAVSLGFRCFHPDFSPAL